MYMFGSAMGCFYSMEWFSLLLFNLMMQKMDVLKNILMAITTNLKMLGMLSLLGNLFFLFKEFHSYRSFPSSQFIIMQVHFILNRFQNNIVSLWPTALLNFTFVNRSVRTWNLLKQEDLFRTCFIQSLWTCFLVTLLVVSLSIPSPSWDKEETKSNKIKKENVSFAELKNKLLKRPTKT